MENEDLGTESEEEESDDNDDETILARYEMYESQGL